jgi:ribosomal protein L37AE/L43A
MDPCMHEMNKLAFANIWYCTHCDFQIGGEQYEVVYKMAPEDCAKSRSTEE